MPGLELTEIAKRELSIRHPGLDFLSFPKSEPGQTIHLTSSGRRLGYCEYVDNSLPTSQMRSVVLLPGSPGTRLFTHPTVRNLGFVPGWRLIVLERPGIGLSDPAPSTFIFADFAADFREFCYLLGLRRVAVIGFSAGTPFATAIACSSGSSGTAVEVAGVALVSAIGPPNDPEQRRGMAWQFKFAYWACTHAPFLVRWGVSSMAAGIRRRPTRALQQAFSSYSAPSDRAVMQRKEVEEMFLESAMELYGRHQEDAVLRENLMIAGRPWGLDLAAAAATRVAIWQGGLDRGCTAAMGRCLVKAIGPKTELRLAPELGHMLYFDVWEEVVAWVNELEWV